MAEYNKNNQHHTILKHLVIQMFIPK